MSIIICTFSSRCVLFVLFSFGSARLQYKFDLSYLLLKLRFFSSSLMLPMPSVAIPFRPYSCSEGLVQYLTFQFLKLSAPDEGYSGNASCSLNLLSKRFFFYLLKSVLIKVIFYSNPCQRVTFNTVALSFTGQFVDCMSENHTLHTKEENKLQTIQYNKISNMELEALQSKLILLAISLSTSASFRDRLTMNYSG